MTALLIALILVVALLVVMVAGLLRSHATILRRLDEIGGAGPAGQDVPVGPAARTGPAVRTVPGVPAPLPDPVAGALAADLVGRGLDDESVVIRTRGVDHQTVLVFLSSGCATCRTFFRELGASGGVTVPAGARLVVVTKGAEAESISELARLAPPGLDLVMSSAAWTDFRVPGSPYVVAVDGASGRIRGEGTGLSWTQVARLLAQATGDLSFVRGGAAAVRKPASDAQRESRVDRELLAAGIMPGDSSLYPAPDGDGGRAGGPE